ncbi:MAG TPA: hypothetical protein VK971_08635 [Thiohalobacter sp.]|nr:hypothetical protein [Thiohalobacter sp.]
MNTLIDQPKDERVLPGIPPRDALPAGKGLATPGGGGAGGGITGPLEESDASTRQYHAPGAITSSDGLFVIELEPVSQIDMTDGEGNGVSLIFDNPLP